jgi:hypothetical protein
MEARTRMGREQEAGQRNRIGGGESRRILAVGKRVDHRWLVEMTIRPRGTAAPHRGPTAAHAA